MAVAAAVVVIIVISAYYLSIPSSLDAFNGKPVSITQLGEILAASQPPYGPDGSQFTHVLRNATGPSLTSGGRPVVFYVGEEGCPYCAEARWSLVLALSRFGNFSSLTYMTSSLDGTDFPTFSFHGATFSSTYVVFQPYELYDRGGGQLDLLPSNYSTPYNSYASGFPFIYFAGAYYAAGAFLPSSIPGYSNYIAYLSALFGTKDWNQVIASLNNAGDPLGSLIKGGANAITSTICKLTGGNPSSVCQQSPITQIASISQTQNSAALIRDSRIDEFLITTRFR